VVAPRRATQDQLEQRGAVNAEASVTFATFRKSEPAYRLNGNSNSIMRTDPEFVAYRLNLP
jgi:hypothetical protein